MPLRNTRNTFKQRGGDKPRDYDRNGKGPLPLTQVSYYWLFEAKDLQLENKTLSLLGLKFGLHLFKGGFFTLFCIIIVCRLYYIDVQQLNLLIFNLLL